MQITYLDGPRLKRALIAGSRRVQKYRDQLNRINVFPVADSDTGTNMGVTLQALTNGLIKSADQTLPSISQSAADAALSGARGNSGTILSQFFYGLTIGINKQKRITTKAFGQIVRDAVDYTYEALSDPVEGTILTVLRVWAENLVEKSRLTSDFAKLFNETLGAAKTALQDTRDKLPNLRKAKVVDAGALGIVHLIEGIVNFIEGGRIREIEQTNVFEINETPDIAHIEEELTYRFCTECMIHGKEIEHPALRSQLSALGDSLIVAGSSSSTKLHIHTDNPETVFDIARGYGELEEQKVDDMHKQYAAAHDQQSEIAVVVDSACDLPPEVLEKDFVHMVPVKVLFGKDSYIDKLALSPPRFYNLLRTRSDVIGTTSQPAPADFEKTFAFLSEHYRHVVYVALSGALSGTIKSAISALERLEHRNSIHIIDSKTVTIGAGLIVRRAVEAVENGKKIQDVLQLIENLVERTKLLITIPSLEALIRSGRIGKTKGIIARMMGLRPLLTLNSEGRVVKAAMVHGAEKGREKIVALMQRSIARDKETDFAVAHVDSADTGRWFQHRIEAEFLPVRDTFVLDASPALALHTGFGTAAVAYIEP